MMPVMRNQNWLPSLFNDFFGDEWMGMQHKHASVPAINIIENEKDFRVELAVPGTTKEDFKVNVNADNELVISLEKRSEKEEKEGDKDKKEGHRGTYLRREFSYTSFQQSFSLPDDVDRQKISAVPAYPNRFSALHTHEMKELRAILPAILSTVLTSDLLFGSDTPIFRLRQVICRHRFTLEQQDKTQEP